MNKLLSQNEQDFDPRGFKDDDIGADLLEDIDHADEYLQNQKAMALASPHSSKRKGSEDLKEPEEGWAFEESNGKQGNFSFEKGSRFVEGSKLDYHEMGGQKGMKEKESLSFTSNSEEEFIKKTKLDDMEIESTFHCSSHLFHPIKYFCLFEACFLCNACKLDHIDHKEYIRNYNENNLLTEIEKLNDKLITMKTIMGDLQTKTKELLEGKIEIITSSQINSLFRSAYAFLTTSSLHQLPQTTKKPSKSKEFFIESSLIKSYQDETFILSLFREKLVQSQVNLLYKGSRDGFSARDFHKFCDRKGPTLVVIKSNKDLIFGGYTSKSWKSREKPEFQKDERSFLFSLSKKTKHELNEKYLDKAIYFSSNKGPVFGSGFDLSISEQCDTDEESFSNLGIAYMCDEDMPSEEVRRHLGGDLYFLVTEIEVFVISR